MLNEFTQKKDLLSLNEVKDQQNLFLHLKNILVVLLNLEKNYYSSEYLR
jgi:hypothetical protein